MTLLVLGLGLWMCGHLMKRLLPGLRSALGRTGKPVVAVMIVAGLVLMIVGYRATEATPIYVLPFWVWYLNNALMLVALVLLDAGRVKGVIRTKIRHPMLTGVTAWSAAHLLVNGDMPSVVLFGGLGIWALAEMAVINRSEGAWARPEPGSLARDARLVLIASVLYAVIVAIHGWLGYGVFVVF